MTIADEWRQSYVSLKDAATILGLKEWGMRALIERAQVEVIRLPLDRRAKYIKRSELPRLKAVAMEPTKLGREKK